MMARFFQITLSAVLVGLISVGCGGDDGDAGFASGAFGSSTGPPDSSGMIFDGVGAADALSDTEIAISWPSATNVEGTPASLMIYHVYRYLPFPGETFDSVPTPSEVTPGWEQISGNGTPAGVTSFIDDQILPANYEDWQDAAGSVTLSSSPADAATVIIIDSDDTSREFEFHTDSALVSGDNVFVDQGADATDAVANLVAAVNAQTEFNVEALVNETDALICDLEATVTGTDANKGITTSGDTTGVITPSGMSGGTGAGVGAFYWVRAEDPQGRKSLSLIMAGCRATHPGAAYDEENQTRVYSDVDELGLPEPGTPHFEFTNMVDDAGRSCLSCHTVTPGLGNLDLDTWEGVMIGTGTTSSPDSFVIPYQADMTWSNFLSGLTSNPAHHLLFLSQASEILDWKDNIIGPWVEDGALDTLDAEPPLFEFDNIDNAGQYSAAFTSFNEVTVTWFQASDPESSPYGSAGLTAPNQLDYFIYYGPDSISIDWDNPLGPLNWDGIGAQSAIIPDYTESGISIVVRGKDKTDNWTTNEREIRLSR